MNHRKNKELILNTLFIIIAILYIWFIYIDIHSVEFFISSNILKYISIVLCFIITLIIKNDNLHKKDILLLQVGLFITVLADLCFLIFNYYIIGIGLFCLVQIIYYYRYKSRFNSSRIFSQNKSKVSPVLKFIKIFLFIIVFYFMMNLFGIKVDFIVLIAIFYSVCILYTTAESIKVFKYNKYPFLNKYMILFGAILFLLCDINVAISNIAREFDFSIYNTSSLLIWIFYLPSQVLLSISGYKF